VLISISRYDPHQARATQYQDEIRRLKESHEKEKGALVQACFDDVERAHAEVKKYITAGDAGHKGIIEACAADVDVAQKEIQRLKREVAAGTETRKALELELKLAMEVTQEASQKAMMLQRRIKEMTSAQSDLPSVSPGRYYSPSEGSHLQDMSRGSFTPTSLSKTSSPPWQQESYNMSEDAITTKLERIKLEAGKRAAARGIESRGADPPEASGGPGLASIMDELKGFHNASR